MGSQIVCFSERCQAGVARRSSSNLKHPRYDRSSRQRKRSSRLVATNHNIKDVDWLQSLNEDIAWIKGDPIQEISQQLNQNRQAGKATSELQIVAHGSNGGIKLGNTFLTKEYVEKSARLVQALNLEAVTCGAARHDATQNQ